MTAEQREVLSNELRGMLETIISEGTDKELEEVETYISLIDTKVITRVINSGGKIEDLFRYLRD